ncbi:hypothetical protein I350_05343 [Cryptococcus amylolentus CBS 6273]|uniref:Velvet domain-containing protein n=1 Tax=Cryptococcus amylolentus CBS 6273 TaxID=1296118 RepID=A0A1E3JV82_9TREE|nr:hypothetical protein I350_05343 [Cryptococcus amylolentus CBS 6273]
MSTLYTARETPSPIKIEPSSATSSARKRKRSEIGQKDSPGVESPSRGWEAIAGGLGRDGWTYHLEIVQEPLRARACGFGNKASRKSLDRRPLTPPPIIRLWIRTATGEIVDPNVVNPNTLILQMDLVSVDGQEERNVVKHPIGSASTATISKPVSSSAVVNQPWTGTSDTSGVITESPRQSLSEHPGYRQRSWADSYASDPGFPRWAEPTQAYAPYPYAPPHSGEWSPNPRSWQAANEGRRPRQLPSPPRPATAPTHEQAPPPLPSASHRHSAGQTLPPLSYITESPRGSTHNASLPSIYPQYASYSRPTSSRSSWDRAHTSQSPGEFASAPADYTMARPSTASSISSFYHPDAAYRDRAHSGPWPDDTRPPSMSYTSDHRPSASSLDDSIVSPRSVSRHQFSSSSEYSSYSPQAYSHTFDPVRGIYPSGSFSADHYLTQPNSISTLVLVGKRHTPCNKLQDEHGQLGLFFFATDLGVRTEGKFRLRMKVMDLALFSPVPIQGEHIPILADTFSEPIEVFSAKRFPGVIPTTDLTRVFASQGIKLAVRENHKQGGRKKKGKGDEGDGDDDNEDEEDDQ